MKTMFIQIIIQEKGSDDYRSFCICRDSGGVEWELRGYGDNPVTAAADAYNRFRLCEDEWFIHGYPVNTGVKND